MLVHESAMATEQLMTSRLLVDTAHSKAFDDYLALYKSRRRALLLIMHLNQLSRAVQRHRGMSLALLAGSDLFHGDFEHLQRQLQCRLAFLVALCSEEGSPLGPRDQNNLLDAWDTIRSGFQDDDVIDNFELHSHFIDQLQTLSSSLARELEKPVSVVVAQTHKLEVSEPPSSSEYPRLFQQIEIIAFSAQQAPTMVEQIARIRGLATFAAAKKECDYHHDRKLRYAISCARAANEKLRHHAERLETVLDRGVSSLSLIKAYELKLMFLLNMVESDILSGGPISANSHQLFKLATEIIDMYLKVVDEAFGLLGTWMDEDLERWIMTA